MASSLKKVKVNKQYDKNDLIKALDDVKKKKLSIRAASKTYNIPFSTLWTKIKGLYPIETRPGPSTVLTDEEENILVSWILHLSKTGFCVTKDQLLDSVQKLVQKLEKNVPFTNGRPSKHWYKAFLNRHAELSTKMAQNISRRRAAVSEENIRIWFEEIKAYLTENNLWDLPGSSIFNCDESSFLLNPKPKKVLVSKEQKVAYTRITGDEKECLTGLVTGNAEGQLSPPLILYPYERIPKSIAASAPAGWALGRCKKGWMTKETFYEYITGTFYPWCVSNEIPFPVILFVDGHSSHLTLPLSNFCKDHQIELISLYPNATHLLQPMDVAFFRPLKVSWSKVVLRYRMENYGVSVSKCNFAPLFKKALDMLDSAKILKNGFKCTGLHPFNPNIIDYSKLIQQNKEPIKVVERSENDEIAYTALHMVEQRITSENLKLFKEAASSRFWNGASNLEALFYLWLDLSHGSENLHHNVNQDPDSVTEIDKTLDVQECSVLNTENSLPINNNNLILSDEVLDLSINKQVTDFSIEIPIDSSTCWVVHEDGSIEQTLNFTDDKTERTDQTALDDSSIQSQFSSLGVSSAVDVESLVTKNQTISLSKNETLEISTKIVEESLDEISEESPCLTQQDNRQTSPFKDITNKNCKDKQNIPLSFKQCLFWPEEKKDERKRKKKVLLPAVTTSENWINYHQELVNNKKKLIEEKEFKRNERIKKIKIKQEKDEEKKKARALKIKAKEKKINKKSQSK